MLCHVDTVKKDKKVNICILNIEYYNFVCGSKVTAIENRDGDGNSGYEVNSVW